MDVDALIVATETERIYMSAICPITICEALQEATRQLSEKGDRTNYD